jgi:glycosyltransferase involved in cell wall biosynthesis
MRLLQLCPLWYPISHAAPGGIESLLAHLGPSLASAGCELTYLASGDSAVPGQLVPVVSRSVCALIDEQSAACYEFYEQHLLRLAVERLSAYDVVHSHIGPSGFVLSSIAPSTVPIIHTLHSPVLDDLLWYLRHNPHVVLTTVSDYQRSRVLSAGVMNHCRVIYNGIETSAFPFSSSPGDRLLFMGRIEEQKGADIAVCAALDAGMPIDVAGPLISPDFYRDTLAPLLSEPNRYVGIVRGDHKFTLLSRASCMVLPSRWAEPFGMTAIEAMACGTPVVALRNGALPELVESGVTGYVVDRPEELAGAIRCACRLDRTTIRARTVARFDISVATQQFVELYRAVRGETRR